MQLQAFAEQPLLWVVVGGAAAVVEAREDVRRVEVGVAPLDVVPDVDRFVALNDRKGADASTPVRAVLIRNADVAAVVIPLPAVERALDDLALNVSAVSQVGAQVLAVGVHHRQLP